MERDEQSGGDAYVDAQIPRALYDRLEALFRDYRGYEPTSVQECLSVVCDLAERDRRAAAVGADRDGAASAPATSGVAADPAHEGAAAGDDPVGGAPAADPIGGGPADDVASAEVRDAIDDVFPTDWSSTETTERLLPLLVKQYVAESDAETRAERENAALSSLAAREGTTTEELRRTLVEDVYGGSALPGDLATEFFSEALEKVERRLDDEEPETLSPSDLVGDERGADPVGGSTDGDDSATVGLDLGPGSADLPAELADEMASDGGAVQSVDERVDNLFTGPNGLTEIGLESLVAGARADCEICGASKSIQSLETTTEASDDRRVDLVCSDCL